MPAHPDVESALTAARALWPGAAVHLGRRGGGGGPCLLVLPSARRPRLLLPGGQRRAAASVALRSSSLTTARQRVARRTLAAAVRLGVVDLVARDRVHLGTASSEGDVAALLGDLLGERVVVGLSVGTARANRKPILQVLDRRGRTLAFVKVGDSDAARALVDREAANLGVVGARDLRRLRIPQVLHHLTWNGLRLLVLSPLGGSDRGDALPAGAMAELAAAGQGVDASASSFWGRLRAAAGALAEGDGGTRLAALVDAAEAGSPVALGWSHGDWTPWNMAWAGDHVHLWDWERFEVAAPIGTDALHHRMQHHAQRTGDWPGAVALLDRDAPALVRAVGGTDDPRRIVDLYLLDLCTRYLTASAGPLGAYLSERAQWLLEVVSGRLGPTDTR